jgi:hypothetical protein
MLRYRILLWAWLFVLGTLAGCSTSAPLDPKAELPYCYKNNKGRPLVCTTANAPSLVSDAGAKRFDPDPAALTVFVVRRIWADGRNVLKVSVDDGIEAETVPRSMVRLKLPPGRHVFSFEFDGTRHSTAIVGKAGEVRFIGLSGSVWAWHSSFDWATEPEAAIRLSAARSRLVADIVAW